MKTKNKKSGIKNQKKKAWYRAQWVKDAKGKNSCFIVKKPDVITVPLTEAAKAMKVAFPHLYEDVIEPVVSDKKQRKRAEVVSIQGEPELHSVTEASKQDQLSEKEKLSIDIARLESHINATKYDEEGAFVGPPKPELYAVPTTTPKVEAISKATPKFEYVLAPKGQVAANDLPKYGSCIKDTGVGMTPSGLPISEFLEGGKYPPPKRTKLHTVTSNDYTYEELAELYDMQCAEMLELKTHYEQRLSVANDMVAALSKDAYDSKSQKAVAGFLEASHGIEKGGGTYINRLKEQVDNSAAYIKELQTEISHLKNRTFMNEEVAVIELQEDLSYLRLENSEMRKEIEGLQAEANLQLYALEQMNKNYARKNSKATLKTLASQYNTYATLHRDDPLRNFFRYSGASISQLGDLRKYFDDECAHRTFLSEERAVYRKWANRERKMLRWAVRTRNEIRAIRSIAINAAVLRKVEIPDGHCKKLAKVTQCNDVGASYIYDVRFRPLASMINHDDYCKVWTEFKAVIPRSEYEDECELKRRREVYDSVKDSNTFKVVKPIVSAVKAVKSVLNYELSSNKRNEAMRKAMLEAKHKAEEASRIKRMREEQFEQEVGTESKDIVRRRMLGLPDHV